ncbi:hypothetical protein BD289DRAFT_85352 [Coniella lustricola]|uniref:Uncharacterized protein n=1 Tax=Coniella lustricola TaxID=2025994 RepID=A0A2T2ZYW9_9PEZI|nr:hypothetical protein BD289DRAFT_85352 [Coniella lustricola]
MFGVERARPLNDAIPTFLCNSPRRCICFGCKHPLSGHKAPRQASQAGLAAGQSASTAQSMCLGRSQLEAQTAKPFALPCCRLQARNHSSHDVAHHYDIKSRPASQGRLLCNMARMAQEPLESAGGIETLRSGRPRRIIVYVPGPFSRLKLAVVFRAAVPPRLRDPLRVLMASAIGRFRKVVHESPTLLPAATCCRDRHRPGLGLLRLFRAERMSDVLVAGSRCRRDGAVAADLVNGVQRCHRILAAGVQLLMALRSRYTHKRLARFQSHEGEPSVDFGSKHGGRREGRLSS